MSHWSVKKEKAGALWQMRFVFFLYKKIGSRHLRIFLYLIAFFFYIFSPGVRRISRTFLQKVYIANNLAIVPGGKDVFHHIFTFSNSLLEKLAAWSGDIQSKKLILKTADIDILTNQLREGKGAIIISSHLGNIEMLRALASLEKGKNIPDFSINPIVDFSGTSKFNKLLEEVNPNSMIHLFNASSIDASAIILLQEKMQNGEVVSIAGDRTAKNNLTRNSKVSFLGETAYFPQGAFILASLLDAPVYYVFAVREDDYDFNSAYEFHVYKSKNDFKSSRKDRMKRIQAVTEEYAGYLEALCKKHPYQWFNFFDFWADPENMVKGRQKNGKNSN